MTKFEVPVADAKRLYTLLEADTGSEYSVEVTKQYMVFSRADYTSGIRVTVPAKSDYEEYFSIKHAYAVELSRYMSQGSTVVMEFGSISVYEAKTGTSVKYPTSQAKKSKPIVPSKWGKDYAFSGESLAYEHISKMNRDSSFMAGKPVLEMAHGHLYFGSASTPGMYVYRNKMQQEVPDFTVPLKFAEAVGWWISQSPNAEVSAHITDTHVKINVGTDFFYTAKYGYKPYVGEKAILKTRMKKVAALKVPNIEWSGLMPSNHHSEASVGLKSGVLSLSTLNVDGLPATMDTPVDEELPIEVSFPPTVLATALALLGVEQAEMLVPSSGTSVVFETDTAEVLVPAKIKIGKRKKDDDTSSSTGPFGLP